MSRVQLPKIDLLQFDGNSLNWPSFWERFSTAVYQNDELFDDEKLAYLGSSMKDRNASEMISPTTGEVHS